MASSSFCFCFLLFLLAFCVWGQQTQQDINAGWPEQVGEQTAGNHRFVIEVPYMEGAQNAAEFTVFWRRRDSAPLIKDAYIVSGVTMEQIVTCTRVEASAENATFVFQAMDGPGIYYLYYMPFYYINDQYDANVVYNLMSNCKSPQWWTGTPTQASVIAQQARTDFDSYSPMETPATAEETASFLAQCCAGEDVVLFPEVYANPIQMQNSIPWAWTQRDPSSYTQMSDYAVPSAWFSFQIGVYALQEGSVSSISYSDFTTTGGSVISNQLFTCYNLGGVDYWNRTFSVSTLPVCASCVVPLWLGVQIPSDAQGVYNGNVTVVYESSSGSSVSKSVDVQINVSGPSCGSPASCDHDVWRGSRMHWFDSQTGFDDSVPSPFTPLEYTWPNLTFEMLDKVLGFNNLGFPSSISVGGIDVLEGQGVNFEVTVGGEAATWEPLKTTLVNATQFEINWVSTSSASIGGGILTQNVAVMLDGSGYSYYIVTLQSSTTLSNVAVNLSVAVNSSFPYFMGFTSKGGFKPSSPVSTKWTGVNGDNDGWLGSTKAGLRFAPKGSDDLWQAGVPYDDDTSPPIPPEWSNGGNGAMSFLPPNNMAATTGSFSLPADQEISFRFSLLVTPAKPLNLSAHWGMRYAQLSGPQTNYSGLKEETVAVVNMHQGNVVNPWINYPYLTNNEMSQQSSAAHTAGLKYKIYNTMRELSNRCREIWAMRAFGGTYITTGSGGDSWIQEHLINDYSVAWSSPLPNGELDAAIQVHGLSRWNNYYVQGISQLMADIGINGVYLDEVAYDRVTIIRTRRVLGASNYIDLHSDQGFVALSPINNYMELVTFIDSLWFGEGFNYDDATPDYWLVEISGLPFGICSDMLRYEGMNVYPFRGMLVGSSHRLMGWSGTDPTQVWALWDSFGIQDATMIGWWEAVEIGPDAVPIASNNTMVKVTSYVKYGQKCLIAIASFVTADTPITLTYNWEALGLNSSSVTLTAPAVSPLQPSTSFEVNGPIVVPNAQGWLLILSS